MTDMKDGVQILKMSFCTSKSPACQFAVKTSQCQFAVKTSRGVANQNQPL
jgi:hypothetical protein